MSFDSIQGQGRAVEFLRRTLSNGHVPSAFLFLGPHHVGKCTTALEYAKAINCAEADGDSCNACPTCRKIDEDTHPDVEIIAPDGQFIRIGQIRDLTGRLALIPFEARKRVIIVAEAERMNDESANAFLKTLEEPPADTLLVLCAESAAQLPETIVSRCVGLRFGLLSDSVINRLLRSRQAGGRPAAGGAGEKALVSGDSADEESSDAGQRNLSEFALRFAQGCLRPELTGAPQALADLREDVLAAMDELPDGNYDSISGRIATWSAADNWPLVLELLETWCHDLIMLGYGAPAHTLFHGDRLELLQRWGDRISPAAAAVFHERILDTRERLLLNVNKALAFDALCLTMQRSLTRSRRR